MSINVLNQRWENSSYKNYKPRYLLGIHNNKLYATVSDNTTIFRFVSFPGTKKDSIIYAAVASKCANVNSTYGPIWQIIDSEEDKNMNKTSLQVISCGTADTAQSTWQINKNQPVGFNYDQNFDYWVKNVLGANI